MDENPVDSQYKELNCTLQIVDKDSDLFQILKEYVKNTHAPTHDQYTLEIMEAFAVER